MFEDLAPQKRQIRLRLSRLVISAALVALACFALGGILWHRYSRLRREGVIASATITGAPTRSGGGSSYFFFYAFDVGGRRYTGWWWSSTTYLQGKKGDHIAVTYLPSAPSINEPGQPREIIQGNSVLLLVVGAGFTFFALTRAIE